jgi:hypothetical protein
MVQELEIVRPEVIELIGSAALPIVYALEAPTAPAAVAAAAQAPLEQLCARNDLSHELATAALAALVAARAAKANDRAAYGHLLRATHKLLVQSGLPAPAELAAD